MSRHVILIIIDGLRIDKLNYYFSNIVNKMPCSGIKLIMGLGCESCDDDDKIEPDKNPTRKIEVKNASTVFPSITLCANASIITGLYPCHHGITGNIYYQRDRNKLINYESKELAPTLYGYYDEFLVDGKELDFEDAPNWSAVIKGHSGKVLGMMSGPDRHLEAYGVKTIYDILSSYTPRHPSHVIFHTYSKGSDKGWDSKAMNFPDSIMWDVPTNTDLLLNATMDSNNEDAFFDHFDKKSAERAHHYINNFPKDTPFPSLLTIYFASIDHACHIRGTWNGFDIQNAFLQRIDECLFNVIKAYRKRFREEFDNTIFIISSDHGHKDVDPEKIITNNTILEGLTMGPWTPYIRGGEGESAYHQYPFTLKTIVTRNGPMMHIYLDEVKYLPVALANLCYSMNEIEGSEGSKKVSIFARFPNGDKYVKAIISKSLSEKIISYTKYFQTINPIPPEPNCPNPLPALISKPIPDNLCFINNMLNNSDRSGDIVLVANQEDKWQFADSLDHAKEIDFPWYLEGVLRVAEFFGSDGAGKIREFDHMRIPFSESFNSRSTHGGTATMEVPLVFMGKCIPQSGVIQRANVVDIVPTILSILGVPIPSNLDWIPLLDKDLKIIPRSLSRIAQKVGCTDSPLSMESLAKKMGVESQISIHNLYDFGSLSG